MNSRRYLSLGHVDYVSDPHPDSGNEREAEVAG